MDELKAIITEAQQQDWFYNLQHVDIKRRGGWQWIATFAKRNEVMSYNYTATGQDPLQATKEAFAQIKEGTK